MTRNAIIGFKALNLYKISSKCLATKTSVRLCYHQPETQEFLHIVPYRKNHAEYIFKRSRFEGLTCHSILELPNKTHFLLAKFVNTVPFRSGYKPSKGSLTFLKYLSLEHAFEVCESLGDGKAIRRVVQAIWLPQPMTAHA